jgi:formylglycine-generating enzyme required for sulfatase activity
MARLALTSTYLWGTGLMVLGAVAAMLFWRERRENPYASAQELFLRATDFTLGSDVRLKAARNLAKSGPVGEPWLVLLLQGNSDNAGGRGLEWSDAEVLVAVLDDLPNDVGVPVQWAITFRLNDVTELLCGDSRIGWLGKVQVERMVGPVNEAARSALARILKVDYGYDILAWRKRICPQMLTSFRIAETPTKAASRPQTSQPAPSGVSIANSIGMRLRRIPAGEFLMGSPPEEVGRSAGETQHRVRIGRPFYVSENLVTQDEWLSVMSRNLSRLRDGRYPVVNVAWNEAAEFCTRLSEREGLRYRLLTEAEWEYCCRAGTTSTFWSGTTETDLTAVAWWGANANAEPHEIGQKPPNPFGLFDMHGNVEEWCQDWYTEFYEASEQLDPKGPPEGTARVIRGGHYALTADHCRSAARGGCNPGLRLEWLGFRVAMEP